MTIPADNPEPKGVQNFEKLPPRKMSLVLQDASPEELTFFTNLLAGQNQINPVNVYYYQESQPQ